jgi:uncharacterized membrane protein YphA (DoxX/SURF4 family)
MEVAMDVLFLIGRILYGAVFLYNAVNHFRNYQGMVGYVGAKGVPAPQIAILGSGVLMLLGGLSVVLGIQPTVGVALLTVVLVPVTLIIHNYWADTDPQARMHNFINFQKNVGLLGAAWMFLLIPRPWPLGLE